MLLLKDKPDWITQGLMVMDDLVVSGIQWIQWIEMWLISFAETLTFIYLHGKYDCFWMIHILSMYIWIFMCYDMKLKCSWLIHEMFMMICDEIIECVLVFYFEMIYDIICWYDMMRRDEMICVICWYAIMMWWYVKRFNVMKCIDE